MPNSVIKQNLLI